MSHAVESAGSMDPRMSVTQVLESSGSPLVQKYLQEYRAQVQQLEQIRAILVHLQERIQAESQKQPAPTKQEMEILLREIGSTLEALSR